MENVTLEVLKGEVMVLLVCESGDLDHSDNLHVHQSSGHDNTTVRQQEENGRSLAYAPRESLHETPEENSDFEEGINSKDVNIERHDFAASILRARQSLQELAASIHMGTVGLVEHPSGMAEKELCSVVVQTGSSVVLPSGVFHSVTTTSSTHAVYAYAFINATVREGEEKVNDTQGDCSAGTTHDSDADPSHTPDSKTHVRQSFLDGQPMSTDFPTFEDFLRFMKRKLILFWRAGRLLLSACHCLLTRSCGKE